MTPEQIHGQARMMAALAKMDGYVLDKHLLRWNDIVETAEFYPEPRVGLVEAIECCIIGSDMYVPKRGPLTMIEMFK